MIARRRRPGRLGLFLISIIWLALVVPYSVAAAPQYAAMVMDARSGKVIHARRADTRLHPASLTKMMTLYVAFEAIENGEISLDDLVRVSKNASAEPPSKLGLRTGQRIKLRYLVRAAAIKSANDASTAIAEAISGSEAKFAARMNRTAKAMGMSRTTFKNAHGLTQSGHLSTARDMTVLGRHMIYDYPQYYNLFSRTSADAGMRTVRHTNSRLLKSYRGADGIKTGYTRAAGFNLVASAERGSERVIATVFGGRSVATRNAEVARLLNVGFQKAPSQVALHRPARPPYMGKGTEPKTIKVASASVMPKNFGKSLRAGNAAVKRSLRPVARASVEAPVVAEAVRQGIDDLVAQVVETAAPAPEPVAVRVVKGIAPKRSPKPAARPDDLVLASVASRVSDRTPDTDVPKRRVVTRISTSGERHWGVNIGRFQNEYLAQKALVRTSLLEMETLDGSLRKVVNGKRGWDANFMGLTRDTAERACRRLQARQVQCFMIGPG